MKAKLENKFIVIAKKDLRENLADPKLRMKVNALLGALNEYSLAVDTYKAAGCGKKFYVCNQDEPYASEIISTILDGENKKCSQD